MNLHPATPLFSNKHPMLRIAAVLLCLLLIAIFGFLQLGEWLTPADTPPDRLDLIVTFAGDPRRFKYSKCSMERYPDAHWLLSDYRNGYGRILKKNQYTMERVSIVDTCKNTLSEIQAAAAWIAVQAPGHSTRHPLFVGLVSSPYHMRRIDLMANRYLGAPGIRYYLLPVPLKKYKWEKKTFRYWWRNESVASISITELFKIGYFLLTGYL